jgi:hypothetical protein
VVIGALEGELAVEHAVKDYSTCPDVDSPVDFVVFLVHEALRSHVRQTARVKVFLSEEIDGPSYSEIDNFNFLLLAIDQQNIFELQIAMYEVVLMAILHPFDNLPEEYLGCLLVEPPFLLDVL